MFLFYLSHSVISLVTYVGTPRLFIGLDVHPTCVNLEHKVRRRPTDLFQE